MNRVLLPVAMIVALFISLTLQSIFALSETAGEVALAVDSTVTIYIIVAAIRQLRARIR